jgi:hypothetical protein
VAIIHRARNPDVWAPARLPRGIPSVDRNHHLGVGLLGYWLFNGASTPIRDLCNRCPPFVPSGTTSQWRARRGGPYFGTTTINETATLADDPSWKPTVAMSFWMRCFVNPSSDYAYGTEVSVNGFGLYSASSGARMYARTTSGWVDPGSLGALSDEADLVWTYDGTTFSCYLNGAFIVSGVSAGTLVHSAGGIGLSNKVAGATNPGDYGAIETQTVAIWGRALSAAEVNALFLRPYDLLIPQG